MVDPELVNYLNTHLKEFGEEALHKQLARDGIPEKDIREAFAQIHGHTPAPQPPAPPKKKPALLALSFGVVLIALAGVLSLEKPAKEKKTENAAPAPASEGDINEDREGSVFRGHYGYMLKLPAQYSSHSLFLDPQKTHERVYLYPKGTDSQHFIHEGLYGAMGILRLDVTRRRVPQGFIGIDTLKKWVTGRLDEAKASYTLRDMMAQGMPAFIVQTEKPFKSVKAYVVGQKVRYEITGGDENAVFTSILSSLYEATPHDRPGK